MAPKVEEYFVCNTLKANELGNMEANTYGRNREAKNSRGQLKNTKRRGRTTNSGLEKKVN